MGKSRSSKKQSRRWGSEYVSLPVRRDSGVVELLDAIALYESERRGVKVHRTDVLRFIIEEAARKRKIDRS